jgi:hypothetical protein
MVTFRNVVAIGVFLVLDGSHKNAREANRRGS